MCFEPFISDTIDIKLGRNVCKIIVKEEIRDIVKFEIKESSEKSGAYEVKIKPMKEDNVIMDESVGSESFDEDDEDDDVRVVNQMVVGDGARDGDGGCEQAEDQQSGLRCSRELNVEKGVGVELEKDASTSKKKEKVYVKNAAAEFLKRMQEVVTDIARDGENLKNGNNGQCFWKYKCGSDWA